LKLVTEDIIEAAAKEMQWPPYAERDERSRRKASRSSAEGGVHSTLQEQSRTLAAIAAQVAKLEELSPALLSIGRILAAVEVHLRNIAHRQGAEPHSESPPNRRQGTG
jgi:hypothetical protein